MRIPEGQRTLGRDRRREQDNIMYFKEIVRGGGAYGGGEGCAQVYGGDT